MYSVAIDGPSGSGKSTLAKTLSKKLGWLYIDTGAMYRTVGLYAKRNQIEPNDEKSLEKHFSKIDIKPTILDLLGIKDEFSIGTSIFSNKDYAFVKGLGFFTSKNYCINDIYYDRKTQIETVEIENLKNLQEKMENEIYLSDTIIKNNLLNNGKIFKIVGE